MTQGSSHDFQIINEAYGSMYGVDEASFGGALARNLGRLSGNVIGAAKKVLPHTGDLVKAAAKKVVKYGSPLALGYALAEGGSGGGDEENAQKNAQQNAEKGGGLTDASTAEDIQKEIANVDKFIAEIDKKKDELLKYKETLNAMLQKKNGGDKQQDAAQGDKADGEDGIGGKVASGISNAVGGLADGAGSVLKGVGQGAGNIVGGVASGIGNVVGGLGKAFGLGS